MPYRIDLTPRRRECVTTFRSIPTKAASKSAVRRRCVVLSVCDQFQELTPEMAMRACNDPHIRVDALSRAIAKLFAKHAKAEYVRRHGK